MEAPTQPDVADDPGTPAVAAAAGSLQAQLRASREKAKARSTRDFAIPGYTPEMRVRYQPLTWKQIRAIGKRNEKVSDETMQEMYVAADTLTAACVDVIAIVDGQELALGVKVGVALAQYLNEESAAETDRQAVLTEIFAGEAHLMSHFGQVMRWIEGLEDEIDEEQLGNSVAAS